MRVPSQFVKSTQDFRRCFIRHAILQGLSGQKTNGLYDKVPLDLTRSLCFEDSLTGLWRYDFDTPAIKLPNGTEIIGTLQFQEMRNLVTAMRLGSEILNPYKFADYLRRLAYSKKHAAVLAEFQPLAHRTLLAGIENEVPGNGKKTVDWSIPDDGEPLLLIEVKSRLKDLIESLESFEFARELGVDEIAAPRHNPLIMFKSAAEKFVVRDPSEAIHCVWIEAHLKQEADETWQAFQRISMGKLHVAIFGGWTDQASFLATNPGLIKAVAQRLGITPGDQFFFVRH